MEGSSIEAPAPRVDIENPYSQLATSMTEELGRLSPMSPLRCIFRVPNRLRCEHEKAYKPRVISIGPLHHGNEALKAMEEHKMRYLQCFMGRTNLSLMNYIEKIKDQEAKLRSCYSETIELESHEFVRIILVDAIFIIEFLIRFSYPQVPDENDCILGEPYMQSDVWIDLLMLENQLPYFILEDLFDPHVFPVPCRYWDKLNGVKSLFMMFLSSKFSDNRSTFGEMFNNLEKTCSSELGIVRHFVDHLRTLCIAPILKGQSAGQYEHTTPPRIEQLHLSGVKFMVGSTNNLFDIRFKDGILEIPKLKTGGETELILRNLVAFEQCTFQNHYIISDYVGIMDSFVDTPTDVELLVKHGIVENLLRGGDNQLFTMINNLSTGVLYKPTNFYYGTLCKELNNFCGSKWNKIKANLRQNYFNTPWSSINFIGGLLFVLILTVIQTICSVLSISNR